MVQVDRLMYCCQESEPLGVVVNILIIEEGFIQKIRQKLFAAALAILLLDYLRNRMNSSLSLYHPGAIHTFLHIILARQGVE